MNFEYHPVDWVIEAKRECFKCKKITPVVYTASPYQTHDRVREPHEASAQVLANRFKFWKKGMNKTQGKEVYANHCIHCGLIQGNGFVSHIIQEALDDSNNNMLRAQSKGDVVLHDPIYIDDTDDYIDRGYCGLCTRKLQPIKNKRYNGGSGKDWKTRRYHIKCWKTLKDSEY